MKKIQDNYFDWVYIDGNHYYEHVLEDLKLSYLKVKTHGVIAGDDYLWGEEYGFPVKQAVHDFVSAYSLVDRISVIGSQFLIRLPGFGGVVA